MSLRKRIFILILLLFAVLLTLGTDYVLKIKRKPIPHPAANISDASSSRIENIIAGLKPFLKEKGFNDSICFLADMRIPSGQNRFFIYDLAKGKVMHASLVTHGRCNETWLTGRKYSNSIGSGCTSKGKYRIGKSYYGKFGLAYKLYGLDSTNNNAFSRFVVLHSHECVPEREIDPYPICQSDGCPTVSPGVLKKLQGIIDKSRKPILLNVYD